MKTRIISGVVAAAIVVLFFVINIWFSFTITFALSILSAFACYEILYNTKAVEKKACVFAAMIYSAAFVILSEVFSADITILTLAYIFLVVLFALCDHKSFEAHSITMALSMPILISFAFCFLCKLTHTGEAGILTFFLLFNFSCTSDIFAYFVGSAIGKHKLAPVISPKKTIEGAIGGLIGATLFTAIICLVFEAIYSVDINITALLIATPVLSAIGIMGDLFMSSIKRTYGIKDYGNLMPGHGGVLDRLDSVLMVAPAFVCFTQYVPIII